MKIATVTWLLLFTLPSAVFSKTVYYDYTTFGYLEQAQESTGNVFDYTYDLRRLLGLTQAFSVWLTGFFSKGFSGIIDRQRGMR
ncbi:hypothetical protein [Candidatus Electrothrix sp.]|uniref:hypothetical protein n=1 Tax=Candidatus Electrothrix sp. TaxID=2170559 RepID=UPI0040575E30